MADKDNELAQRRSAEMDPYGPEYPITLLAESIDASLVKADHAIDSVITAVSKDASVAVQVARTFDKGVRYVVDTSDSMRDSLERGDIKFTQENGGKMYAQIRESNGRYGEKVPIKREEFGSGIDPVQMANAMQLRALQAQVEEMQDSIKIIDLNVRDVLQGQHNDRIALYQSGLGLYLEARSVSDEALRKQLSSQAIRALSDASSQLALQLQSDVRWLKDEAYKQVKGKNKELILERMGAINRSFESIHQANVLKAAIYGEMGEYSAMVSALDSYAHFIESEIVENAGFLAECDPEDDGYEHGTWKKRSGLSLKMGDLSNRLRSNDTILYLSPASEDGEDEED